MSQDHRLQQQRFELKYLIHSELVQPIRDFVASYLELDDFSRGKRDNAYDIHSIYFDSPGLHTHRATVNGDKNRFKLRLRHYDLHPDSPVFIEIKRRVDDCILKSRCGIRKQAVPMLAAGIRPDEDQILTRGTRHLLCLHRFLELMVQLNASPQLRNHYRREAWVSPHDNSVRVTFDRDVHVEPCFGDATLTSMKAPAHIYSEHIILELKFTGRYPVWFRALVERFQLMRCGAMKYSGGVAELGEHAFRRRTAFPEIGQLAHAQN